MFIYHQNTEIDGSVLQGGADMLAIELTVASGSVFHMIVVFANIKGLGSRESCREIGSRHYVAYWNP